MVHCLVGIDRSHFIHDNKDLKRTIEKKIFKIILQNEGTDLVGLKIMHCVCC